MCFGGAEQTIQPRHTQRQEMSLINPTLRTLTTPPQRRHLLSLGEGGGTAQSKGKGCQAFSGTLNQMGAQGEGP